MAFSVTTALDEHVSKLETERKPDGTWHPSSISGCLRKALYDYTGVPKSNPHDARTSRVFRVGHLLHEFLQEAVAASDDVLVDYAEVKLDYPDIRVSGAVDGLVQHFDGTWEVLEYKTINSNAFRYNDLPKEDHKLQAGIYLLVLREHGGVAANGAVIPPLGDLLTSVRFVYLSKDDLKIAEYDMPWTDELEAEIRSRLYTLEYHLEEQTLPDRLPLVEKKTGPARDYRCGYCPFLDTCWEES